MLMEGASSSTRLPCLDGNCWLNKAVIQLTLVRSLDNDVDLFARRSSREDF
jgi:hypothetical protein